MEKLSPTLSRFLRIAQFFRVNIQKNVAFLSHIPPATWFIVLLLIMFPLGYLESLRWHLPPPKATHGLLKGLFLVGILLFVIFRRQVIPRSKARTELSLTLVLLFSFVVSALFSLAPHTSLLFLWYPAISVFYLFVFRSIRLPRLFFAVVHAVSILLILITFLFAIFSIFSRYEVDNVYYFLFLDHRANYFLDEIRRAGKYVSLGPYLMLTPLATMFLIEENASRIRKLVSAIVLGVSVMTAVISNNRIDVLVIFIQLVVMVWLFPRRLAVMMLLLIIPITLAGLSITEKYFGFNLEERILRPQFERDTETIVMRQTYWQTAFYNFRQYPIFGTGPNTYNEVSDFPLRRYYDRGSQQYTVRPDEGIGIHNVFVERLADTGLVGFFAFISILFYFLRSDILAVLQRRGVSRGRYILYALSSWSWILYGITDNGYGAQGFVTFFFLRGMIGHL